MERARTVVRAPRPYEQACTGGRVAALRLAGFVSAGIVFGDSLDRTVTWKEQSDTSALAGRPVRLRFRLRDAEVYAFQFTE